MIAGVCKDSNVMPAEAESEIALSCPLRQERKMFATIGPHAVGMRIFLLVQVKE